MSGAAAVAEMEEMVLAAGGVVLRYGQFYGLGTYHPGEPPPPPIRPQQLNGRKGYAPADLPEPAEDVKR